MSINEFKSDVLAIFPQEDWRFNEPHLEAQSKWLGISYDGEWLYSNAASVHGTGASLKDAILDADLKQRQFLLSL